MIFLDNSRIFLNKSTIFLAFSKIYLETSRIFIELSRICYGPYQPFEGLKHAIQRPEKGHSFGILPLKVISSESSSSYLTLPIQVHVWLPKREIGNQ